MGRYYPPPEDTTLSSSAGKKPAPFNLRSQTPPTVRFEMPFAIWCTNCVPNPIIIGQGVRFNAIKNKVGMYYSTPIWSFTIKHSVCSGEIEIRTDPAKSEYIVCKGASKRDYGHDNEAAEEGDGDAENSIEGSIVKRLGIAGQEEKREDAFALLEGRKADSKSKKEGEKRIEELYRASEKSWDDPWEKNRLLRKGFRVDRKRREKDKKEGADIQKRLGLGVEILPESEIDRKLAGLIDFKPDHGRTTTEVLDKPLFARNGTNEKVVKSTSTKRKDKIDSKNVLAKRLQEATFAAINPLSVNFNGAKVLNSTPLLTKINQVSDLNHNSEVIQQTRTIVPLVMYDSD